MSNNFNNASQELAFPIISQDGSYATGLNKREYFAAMALQGYIASYAGAGNPNSKNAAEMAVRYADALLQELYPESITTHNPTAVIGRG